MQKFLAFLASFLLLFAVPATASMHAVSAKTLRTIDLYTKADGCFIAVYSHDSRGAAYSVGPDIYVLGQIRVQGTFDGRVCQPTGFEGQDISASDTLKDLTDKYFPGRRGGTWPGGDTGGENFRPGQTRL